MNIDSHCHFDQLSYDEREKEVSKNIVVAVATGYESGNRLLEYAGLYQNLRVCMGIHPEYFQNYDEFDLVEKQIKDNLDKISGIGEIGLPYFNLENLEESEKREILEKSKVIFGKFLSLAEQENLAVNLHCVEDSASYAIQELKKYNIKKALFHWFEGSDTDLKEIIKMKWRISVSPDIVHNIKYREFVSKVPLEIICLESDGPWEYDGIKGVPSMIEKSAEILSEIYQVPAFKILEISNKNSNGLFSNL